MDQIFEKATRTKLRFECKGSISVEDLWDLPLEKLDALYSQLDTKQKAMQETSLLKKKTKVNETLDLQMAIVKHIVEIRLKEQEEREAAAIKKAQRQKLDELIARKKDAELEGKSLEELEALRNQL